MASYTKRHFEEEEEEAEEAKLHVYNKSHANTRSTFYKGWWEYCIFSVSKHYWFKIKFSVSIDFNLVVLFDTLDKKWHFCSQSQLNFFVLISVKLRFRIILRWGLFYKMKYNFWNFLQVFANVIISLFIKRSVLCIRCANHKYSKLSS